MALIDGLLQELQQEAQTTRRVLERVPDAHLGWKPHAKSMTLGQPRAAVLRAIMLNHWYHHRGQLSVYLRLLGVPVPSIYGPSADENPFAPAPSVTAAAAV